MKNFGSRSTLVTLLLTLTTMLGCSSLNANPVATQQAQDGATNASGGVSLNARSINFGNVPVGKTQTHSVTVSNPGLGTMTITKASIVGSGFAITGPSMPLVLAPKKTASIGVSFTPAASGTETGIISLTGSTRIRPVTTSNRRGREVPVSGASTTVSTTFTISLSGVGTISGQLAVSPAALALGKVRIGASQTQSVTLANSGTSTVTVKQATVTGRGFKMSGLSFPTTLSPGQKKTFSVTFTPQSAGSSTGSVAVTSDAPNPVVSVPVSGVAVGSNTLTSSPSSISFGSLPVNSTNTLSETLTNTGSSTVTVSQASVSGTGFRVTGLSLPLTLAAGQSFTFGAVFAPTAGGSVTGSISVISDAANSTLTIPLDGTASVSGQLAVSPGALNFGSVTVGQTKSLPTSLTANGSSITITAANMSTSEFTVSGLSLPVTLAAGKSVSFTISFTPQSSGAASASASFVSNASNPSLQQSSSGNAAAAPQHSVALSWTTSSSTSVVGYNIYRGAKAGGPYSQINSMNADNTFTDGTVQAGQTYFYVTTAVDGTGKESTFSNQTQATIPAP